jgi:hypothetical protein
MCCFCQLLLWLVGFDLFCVLNFIHVPFEMISFRVDCLVFFIGLYWLCLKDHRVSQASRRRVTWGWHYMDVMSRFLYHCTTHDILAIIYQWVNLFIRFADQNTICFGLADHLQVYTCKITNILHFCWICSLKWTHYWSV